MINTMYLGVANTLAITVVAFIVGMAVMWTYSEVQHLKNKKDNLKG